MLERRLAMSERADPTDDPGLVLGDDGIVYEVAANGTRTPLNSGSMPAEWTVDPVTGALLITISQVDVSGLIVDNFDINYDFTDDGIVISGKNGASGSVEVDDGSGHFGQLDGGGGLLIRNDPTDNWSIRVVDMSNAPVFGVARDGTVHIKTGTVIVADL